MRQDFVLSHSVLGIPNPEYIKSLEALLLYVLPHHSKQQLQAIRQSYTNILIIFFV